MSPNTPSDRPTLWTMPNGYRPARPSALDELARLVDEPALAAMGRAYARQFDALASAIVVALRPQIEAYARLIEALARAGQLGDAARHRPGDPEW